MDPQDAAHIQAHENAAADRQVEGATRPHALRASAAQTLFHLGLDERAPRYSRRLGRADPLEVLPLASEADLRSASAASVSEILTAARSRLARAGAARRRHGVVGDLGAPISLLLPLLRDPFDLPGPRFESVLKCDHKYLSRLVQRQTTPEHVPAFAVIDPFSDEAPDNPLAEYPVFVKPVCASDGYLVYRVRSDSEWADALERIRGGLPRVASVFDAISAEAPLPAPAREVTGRHCLVEQALAGRKCTMEAYVCGGEMTAYAFIDTIRAPNKSTVLRHQYPSSLSAEVQAALTRIGRALMEAIALDDSPFNIEFLVDDKEGRIGLLEINATIARAHADLFYHVEGTSHHDVAIALSLGEAPKSFEHRGEYRHAAHCYVRHFADGTVRRTPIDKELEGIRRDIPGVDVHVSVAPGTRLAELPFQDAYSYELATIFIGAHSQRELLRKLRHTQARLRFEIEPV